MNLLEEGTHVDFYLLLSSTSFHFRDYSSLFRMFAFDDMKTFVDICTET